MDGRRKIAVMLKGHESLLRLVGKRRKLYLSVFTFQDPDAKPSDGLPLLCESESGKEFKVTDEARGKENSPFERVSCPVCSTSIKGNVINNHLDICLAQQEPKGITRRKSTQLTLFSSMKRKIKTSKSEDKAQT